MTSPENNSHSAAAKNCFDFVAGNLGQVRSLKGDETGAAFGGDGRAGNSASSLSSQARSRCQRSTDLRQQFRRIATHFFRRMPGFHEGFEQILNARITGHQVAPVFSAWLRPPLPTAAFWVSGRPAHPQVSCERDSNAVARS